jgi:hypothetical protein
MKTAFQMPAPIAVSRVNVGSGMRVAPAGTETMLRTSGMKRPKSTIQVPWRSKNRSPRCRSASPKRMNHRWLASTRSRS